MGMYAKCFIVWIMPFQCWYDEDSCSDSIINAEPEFECENGEEIAFFLRCNYDTNCNDGTDEKYCEGMDKVFILNIFLS